MSRTEFRIQTVGLLSPNRMCSACVELDRALGHDAESRGGERGGSIPFRVDFDVSESSGEYRVVSSRPLRGAGLDRARRLIKTRAGSSSLDMGSVGSDYAVF